MPSTLNALARELGRDVNSNKAIPALFCGSMSAVIILVFSTSMAAAIFSGPLAPFFTVGAGIVLFSYCVIGAVVALTSGLPGAMAGAPAPTVMMLVVIAGTIDLEGTPLFMTAVAVALIGTAATGLCFLVIGHLRLANFLRFIPYPVSGGFIAGTGGLACLIALDLLGVFWTQAGFPTIPEPGALPQIVVGIGFALGLFITIKLVKGFLIFPATFAIAAIAYHVGLAVLGISGDEAREAGLLFSGTAHGGLWPPFGLSDLPYIDWSGVAGQIPNLLILATVTLICVVMNLVGIELAANCDLDWNKEFRSAGWANVLTGLGGAPPGCLIALTSIRNTLFGAMTRLTGLVTAVTLGSVLLVGDVLLTLFPVPLIGGVLFFLGLQMLDEWLVRSFRKLVLSDYLIIVVVFATIVTLGFLEGIGIGMLVTGVIFVISLGRTDAVESRFTLRDRQSRKTRAVPDRAILLAEGHRAQAYLLRGYLFFGIAYRLADRLRQSLKIDPAPNCILLGFENVSGFDFSAVNAIVRFIRSADAEGVKVVIFKASDRFEATLRAELPTKVGDRLAIESDEDHALERCEDIIIGEWKSELRREDDMRRRLLDSVVDDLERHLDRQARFEKLVDELGTWSEARTYRPGEAIVSLDAPREGLQLLTEGRASQFNPSGTRIFQFSPGDVIEPLGAFDSGAATTATIADAKCRTLLLTPTARAHLGKEEPDQILKLYEYILTANATTTTGD